jgi:hypothetical protein
MSNIQVEDLLTPNVQTDIITSFLQNTVNHFTTKPNHKLVQGVISNKPVHKIKEASKLWDAYQLQPTIFTDDGVFEYKDILIKLDKLGVNLPNISNWGKVQTFNFIPPINLDKLINYQNYVWHDTTEPQYITIANKCNQLNAALYVSQVRLSQLDKINPEHKTLTDKIDTIKKNITTLTTQYNKRNDVPVNHNTQWIRDNKWVHKSTITGYTKTATAPIIEYNDDIVLNSWMYVPGLWQYRKSVLDKWQDSTNIPTRDELVNRYPIDSFIQAGTNIDIVVNGNFNYTGDITILESAVNNGVYTVTSVIYSTTSNKTVIKIQQPILNTTAILDLKYTTNIEVIGGTSKYGVLIPFTKTSLGDPWQGLHTHWRLINQQKVVYVNEQPGKIDTKLTTKLDTATNIITTGSTFYYNCGDVRVYIDGIRTYNYTEIDCKAITTDKIKLNNTPPDGAVISVYAGAICEQDKDLNAAYINTGTKIERKNVTRYHLNEQIKYDINQYPLFDIYKPNGNTAYDANPIFIFNGHIINNTTNPLKQATLFLYSDMQEIPTQNISFINLLFNKQLYCYKDTTLKTIWRKSELYTPKLVNEHNMPPDSVYYIDGVMHTPTINDCTVYEIPSPLYYNINHACNTGIHYTELTHHIQSNIIAQPIEYKHAAKLLQYELCDKNTALGGYIKEHNGGYDIFASAVIQKYTPLDIIAYAKKQYKLCTKFICDEFITQIAQHITGKISSDKSTNVFVSEVNNTVLNSYKQNTNLLNILQDSTAIHNWIATLPVFGIIAGIKPKIIGEQLVCHDGHYYTPNIDVTQIIHNTQAPNTNGAFRLFNKQLQRFYVQYHITVLPANTFNENDLHYNPTSNTLKIFKSNVWVVCDISTAWTTINLNECVIKLLLNFENALYTKCNTSLVLDIPAIKTLNNVTFNESMNTQYNQFIRNNSDIEITENNPFTWNYARYTFDIMNQPRDVTTKQPKFGNFKILYEYYFNTAYPNLEPWKLQGYTEKPALWDSLYKTTNGWSATMWTNIKSGIIHNTLPALLNVPQYKFVCVNLTNGVSDGYGYGDLLPPLVRASGALMTQTFGYFSNIMAYNVYNDVDITLGNNTYIEQMYLESIDYNYDLLISAFRAFPLHTFNAIFGYEYYNVDGLDIEKRTNTVISRKNMYFHTATTPVNGINQWYVNYWRYNEHDVNSHNLINKWVGWDTYLAYNASTFIADVDYIKTMHTDIDEYDLVIKETENVNQLWIHSLTVHKTANDYVIKSIIPKHISNTITYNNVNQYYISDVDTMFNAILLNTTTPWVNGTVVFVDSNITSIRKGTKYLITVLSNDSIRLRNFTTSRDVMCYDEIRCFNVYPSSAQDYDVIITPDQYYMQYRSLAHKWVRHDTKLTFLVTQTPLIIFGNGHKLMEDVDYTVNNLFVTMLKAYNTLKITMPLAIDCVISEIKSIFNVNGTNYAHVQPNDVTTTITLPHTTHSIPQVINVIDGYCTFLLNNGVMFNDYERAYSETQDTISSWHNEIIKFIDYNDNTTKFSSYEFNPFKYNIWFSQNIGTISNILPIDEYDKSVIYDNLGNLINTPENVKVYRKNDMTHITYTSNSNYIGGIGINMLVYNHTIKFNNYVNNNLIYDPFLGIQTESLYIAYYRDIEYDGTLKLSGKFLTNGKFVDNIESLSADFRNAYDTTTKSTDNFTALVNDTLQLKQQPYLNTISASKQTQMDFCKQILIHKGTNYAVSLLQNTSNLINIEFDEFFAYHVYTYGYVDSRLDGRMRLPAKAAFKYDATAINVYGFDVEALETQSFDKRYDGKLSSMRQQLPAILSGASNYLDGNVSSKSLSFLNILPSADLFYNNLQYTFYLANANALAKDGFAVRDYSTNGFASGDNELTYNPRLDKFIHSDFVYVDYTDNNRWHKLPDNMPQPFPSKVTSVFVYYSDDIIGGFGVDLLNDSPRGFDEISFGAHKLLQFDDCDNVTEFKMQDIMLLNTPNYNNYIGLDTTGLDTAGFDGTIELGTSHYYIPIDLCDSVSIKVMCKYNTHLEAGFGTDGIIKIAQFIISTNMLRVYVGGKIIKFDEIDDYTIKLHNNRIAGVAFIVYDYGILCKDVHYTFIHKKLIKLNRSVVNLNIINVMVINMHNIDTQVLSGTSIVTGNTKLSDIDLWHPALNIHAPLLNHSVNHIQADDPAQYLYKFNDATTPNYNCWNSLSVGTRWVDTSRLGYIDYYDDIHKPQTFERIATWGNTTPWSHITAYEWVKSPITPQQWADKSNTSSITEIDGIVIAGKPMSVLYKRIKITPEHGFDVSNLDDILFDSVPDKIWSDWYIEKDIYQVVDVYKMGKIPLDYNYLDGELPIIADITTRDAYTVYVNGVQLLPDTFTPVWAGNVLQSIIIDFVNTGDTIAIVTDDVQQIFLNYVRVNLPIPKNYINGDINITTYITSGDIVNVYINDVLTTNYSTIWVNDVLYRICVGGLIESDIVRIVRVADTVSDAQIKALSNNSKALKQYYRYYPANVDYKYTNSKTKKYSYYFWVKNYTVPKNNITIRDCESLFLYNNNPYIIYLDINSDFKYQSCVIKNASTYTDNCRICFVQDHTARWEYSKPDVYNEYALFRKNQQYKVDVNLWNRIKAVAASKYINHDKLTGDTTMYGINGKKQFCKALSTTILDIISTIPNNTTLIELCSEVKIDALLDYIYNNYNIATVNYVFFELLQVLLTESTEIDGLFKTSKTAAIINYNLN